jgi:hypothetical protein
VDSDLLTGEDFREALDNTLMIAAAQGHVDSVKYILDLDRDRQLDLAILRVGERVNRLLLCNYVLEEEAYLQIRKLIANHLYNRNLARAIAREPELQERTITIPATETEAERTAVVPNVHVELRKHIIDFLRRTSGE